MYIKRDDLTGFELSGNKVRKIEFLMEDVISGGNVFAFLYPKMFFFFLN